MAQREVGWYIEYTVCWGYGRYKWPVCRQVMRSTWTGMGQFLNDRRGLTWEEGGR